jgi:hypothetical protein
LLASNHDQAGSIRTSFGAVEPYSRVVANATTFVEKVSRDGKLPHKKWMQAR